MLTASVFAIMAMINFFRSGGFSEFARIILFVFIFMLTILALNIIITNYPDTPVAGKQKTNFNRLFLFNFLFLVFLFGIIIAEYRELSAVSELFGRTVFQLPFNLYIPFLTHLVILFFQLAILYGLYELRRELYFNFMKKKFEFEKDQVL
jgi:hypothetical protein